MPIGVHTINWIATDVCNNESSCSLTITVADELPPVASCQQHIIVSLSSDGPGGLTLINADVFDDGSYDNCTDVVFSARRMDSCIDFDWTTGGAGIDDIPNNIVDANDEGTILRPKVPFACCDIYPDGEVASGPVMIELEVRDAGGNVNYCMVEVSVQDKLAPQIECPPDIVVSCTFSFDSEVDINQFLPLTEDPMADVFGTVLDAFDYNDDESQRQAIIVNDAGRPANSSDPDYILQPNNWGVDGWADDNCDVNVDVSINIIDDCTGQNPLIPQIPTSLISNQRADDVVRFVEREFKAVDNQNNASTCYQRIWVVDFDPFFITDETCNNSNPDDGVIWPCDVFYNTCPDSIIVTPPTILNDDCSLIGVTFVDSRFNFVEGACYKILREWSVIDWCQFNPNTGAGIWTYTQEIKVIDSSGPSFNECPAEPVTLCLSSEGLSGENEAFTIRLPDNNQVFLGELNPGGSSCSAHVSGTHLIEEFCSDSVKYDVKVYLFNGPDYVQLVNETKVKIDENGQAVLEFNTRNSVFPSIAGGGLPYNSDCLSEAGGYHRVLWSVEDGCGNLTTCEYLLRLEDCKAPSPVCIEGISTAIMPNTGEVVLWANEYNASSIDDCTPSENLLFSFEGDVFQPSKVFSCENIPTFGAEHEIDIWVADEGSDKNCDGQIEWSERNKTFCTTTIVITDNDGVCGSGNIISGEILTHADLEPVEMTTINLTHPSISFPGVVTAENGQYTFSNVPADGPYTITPYRNDNHQNGVSTLDLVRIQKHLIGTELFTDAYQYIAADANNNQEVSAIDLVEIRKLILGLYSEFPNNTSWRFIDHNFTFGDVANPWPFVESITMDSLNEGIDYLNENFMAVKVGDLNNTVVANSDQVAIRGGRNEVRLTALAKATTVTAGEVFEIEMTIPSEVIGFQWTLDLDGINYLGIGSDQLNDENVGIHHDQITMSFENISGNMSEISGFIPERVSVSFKLKFEAAKDGRPSEMIKVSSDITEAEGYVKVPVASASEIEIVNIDLHFVIPIEREEYALYQNEPNPFIDQTLIGFDLPRAMNATLTIYDATGKVVKEIEGDYAAGYNTLRLNRKDLLSSGVYYYHLKAGDFRASKQLVVVK
jgi:hypothetical protein